MQPQLVPQHLGLLVKSDEILCELETDKVSVEVPSPSAGVLKEIIAAEGSTVDATAILAVIGNVEGEGNARGAVHSRGRFKHGQSQLGGRRASRKKSHDRGGS